MQLVGATKKFIQTPFLISNLTTSISACFLGNLILILLLFLTIAKIPEIKNFISIQQLISLLICVSIVNLMISFFSTWICVRKYLNLKTHELYK